MRTTTTHVAPRPAAQPPMEIYGAARCEVSPTIRMQQRNQEERGEQKERVVLGEQGQSPDKPRGYAESRPPRLDRPEKQIRRPWPRTKERRIDIEFEGPNRKRRRQDEKQNGSQASERAEEKARKHPYARQRHGDIQGRQEIEARVGARHDRKPRSRQPRGQRRVLGITELEFLAPRPQLRHVVVYWSPSQRKLRECRERDDVEQQERQHLAAGRRGLLQPSQPAGSPVSKP